MDVYKETFETWNKTAVLYQDKFMDLDLYNESYDLFCNSLKKQNSSVLEIGCGPGNITKYLLTKRPDLSLLGIDVAPKMIELASVNNPTADFKTMDCRFIHTLNSKFDAIICGFCLPYLTETDCAQLIYNCNELLKTKGTLYLSFVEGNSSHSGFQVGSNGNRIYFHYYTLNTISQILMDNGFEEPRVYRVHYNRTAEIIDIHTILLTTKK